MNSLNRRKDEEILNDLHSAEGRLNSSEIIDLETEIKTNEMKEKIHKTNMEEEMNELKKSFIEEVQKNLFVTPNTTEQKNERQERFRDFLEFREIKEEDYPIIAELYMYPNDKFIRSFHNSLYFEKERSGKMIQSMIEDNKDDQKSKRFFELFLSFFEKYDYITTNHMNRIMEDKKEWKH